VPAFAKNFISLVELVFLAIHDMIFFFYAYHALFVDRAVCTTLINYFPFNGILLLLILKVPDMGVQGRCKFINFSFFWLMLEKVDKC